MTKKRELNFEILRIISTILIIAHHYVLYCSNIGDYKVLSSSSLLLNFLLVGGKFAIILFVLITGYFSINNEHNSKKILKITLHTEFYSLVFLILGFALKEKISIITILKSIFPIIYNHYWFASAYVVLFLLIPVLNKTIKNLSKKEYLRFLIIMSLFINILPSIAFCNFSIGNIGYLIYIYFIGAYIKLHCNNNQTKKYKFLIVSVIFYLMAYFLTIVLKLSVSKFTFFMDSTTRYLSLNSIFLYVSAISLFLFFKNIKINNKFNKLILFFSTTSFGVYLIHENIFIRDLLWKRIFYIDKINFIDLLKHSLISIFLVFLVCSLIDYIYLKFVEKKLLKFGNKVINFIQVKTIRIIRKFTLKI